MLFANVCAGVFLFLVRSWWGKEFFLGFLASPWCLVHLGGASFASHPPSVYKACVCYPWEVWAAQNHICCWFVIGFKGHPGEIAGKKR